MDRKVILGVAGAGKTYRICHEIDPKKKNLLIAFTHENIHNIHRELSHLPGGFPLKTEAVTFDSFVHRFAISPFVSYISKRFDYKDEPPRGVTLIKPPVKSFKMPDGSFRKNPCYHRVSSLLHYIDSNKRFYCDSQCELVIRVGDGLLNKIIGLLNRCYDSIYIDEFQDFRLSEYEFLSSVCSKLDSVTLVGDFYQHSVVPLKNFGAPYENKKIPITYDEFKSNLEMQGFVVDEATLRLSRRCSPNICEFIRTKLNIKIYSDGRNSGVIRGVADNEIESLLKNERVWKLVWNDAKVRRFSPCVNWSYSKGDTYPTTCIILTGKDKAAPCILDDGFDASNLSVTTRNTLYVALTRSSGDVYIITPRQAREYNL